MLTTFMRLLFLAYMYPYTLSTTTWVVVMYELVTIRIKFYQFIKSCYYSHTCTKPPLNWWTSVYKYVRLKLFVLLHRATVDMRCYDEHLSGVPEQLITPAIVMHCALEQVKYNIVIWRSWYHERQLCNKPYFQNLAFHHLVCTKKNCFLSMWKPQSQSVIAPRTPDSRVQHTNHWAIMSFSKTCSLYTQSS